MPEEKSKRVNLSKKIRFEIFKRDSFTCQYCGGKAPEIVLQCDHIEPVSKGGTDDILNLITACSDCNSGKSDRRLSENSVVEKRHQQLAELQERKEQMEMMFDWQKEMLNIDEEMTNRLARFWNEMTPGYSLNDTGLAMLRKLRQSFTIEEIMQAMKIATEKYYDTDTAWEKLGGICRVRMLEKETPELGRLYYIRGILRNRLTYFDDRKGLGLLKEALALGANVESLEDCAKEVRNWTQWRRIMEGFIANPEGVE